MTAGQRVWIQGAGEMASGAAVALLEAGHRVVMADIDNPVFVRRLVCFGDAVYQGTATVAGWTGTLVPAGAAAFVDGGVAVLVDPTASQMMRLDPTVVVDARMTKRDPAPLPAEDRPVIGLGPGFICGRDADLVVETQRGPDLGRVIAQGAAAAYTGRPGSVGGETAARLLRAPAAGHLTAVFEIGDLVRAGEVIGHVSGVPVVAGLAGRLRGLVHPRAELVCGKKVGDVDPRGMAIDPAQMTDKAIAVGTGVVRAVAALGDPDRGPRARR